MTDKELFRTMLAQQEEGIARARMPSSTEDAKNLGEFMKYSRANPSDPLLFTQTPESQESPTTDQGKIKR